MHLGTSAVFDLPVDLPLLGMAFCGTSLLYLADRALGPSPEDRVNRPGRLEWRRQNWLWILAEALGLTTGILACLPFLQGRTMLAGIGIGGLGLVHVLPGLGGWGGKPSGWGKPLLVSGVWAAGAVLLPVVEAGHDLTPAVYFVLGYRWLLILPNVLFADWSDRKGDRAAGLRSWARGWSLSRVRWGGSLLAGTAALAAGGAVASGWAPWILLVDALGGGAMVLGIWTLDPGASARQALLLDLLVGWPVVTALVDGGLA